MAKGFNPDSEVNHRNPGFLAPVWGRFTHLGGWAKPTSAKLGPWLWHEFLEGFGEDLAAGWCDRHGPHGGLPHLSFGEGARPRLR